MASLRGLHRLLKDPIGVGTFFLFEKLRLSDGRRVLSTNFYKKLAKKINSSRTKASRSYRDGLFNRLTSDTENTVDVGFMAEGWGLWNKTYFPFTQAVVEDGIKIYRNRAEDASRIVMPYSIASYKELLEIDSFRNFAFSQKMLEHAAHYLGDYPYLVSVELLRSDPRPGVGWIESQQAHLDIIDTKVFRVVVMISDVGDDNGPFSFFPLGTSRKIARDKRIRYGAALSSMNIPDELLSAYQDDLIVVKAESGDVLTVDTCNCFHLGSRATDRSRCVLMLSYASSSLENMRGAMDLDIVHYGNDDDTEFVRAAKFPSYFP